MTKDTHEGEAVKKPKYSMWSTAMNLVGNAAGAVAASFRAIEAHLKDDLNCVVIPRDDIQFVVGSNGKLIEKEGGQGVVRQGVIRHPHTYELVAVKEFYCTDNAIDAFVSEVQAMQEMALRNCTLPLRIIGYCRRFNPSNGQIQLRIISHWMEHGNIMEFVKKRDTPITTKDRIKLCREMALCVQALHDAGVFHGDVKPNNFLVKDLSKLSLVISDFGMSILIDTVSAPNVIPGGTDSFKAPELNRPGAKPTAASDGFALGVSIAFILSGRIPAVGVKIEPSDGFPSELTELVFQACREDPDNRAKCESIVETLTQYLKVEHDEIEVSLPSLAAIQPSGLAIEDQEHKQIESRDDDEEERKSADANPSRQL